MFRRFLFQVRRGRYELQIEYDPEPEGLAMRTGGVYGFLAPHRNRPGPIYLQGSWPRCFAEHHDYANEVIWSQLPHEAEINS
jgi:hypothetical protein